ncbi:TSUP family transporter [Rhodobacteraceae bacterium 2CG4]|uniref:Probable membrane transporter protein n=1 Tax=Halovulum marinum TaxID=2662447 RepID=A0A6L5YW84_9RHOB|nr:sulfite exporter TauE/SafE family protein [Halovulum marinum]MSU88616.1 TSUP family transporter [Halovulum marinum]
MPELSLADPAGLAAVFVALFLGGILKGATGAGLPVIAIPVISAVYDVRVAVALMVMPNLVTNLWQVWRHRSDQVEGGFGWIFAGWGALGAAAGTFLLIWLPVSVMQLAMVAIILGYITLRLLRPDVSIGAEAARGMVGPVGFAGGILQGATGISSPVSVTFLNAMRLPRLAFIHTISCFFAVMCAGQAIVQLHYGLLTLQLAALGLAALVPMFLALPLGEWIGRRISARTFDMVMVAFLALLSLRLVWVEFV